MLKSSAYRYVGSSYRDDVLPISPTISPFPFVVLEPSLNFRAAPLTCIYILVYIFLYGLPAHFFTEEPHSVWFFLSGTSSPRVQSSSIRVLSFEFTPQGSFISVALHYLWGKPPTSLWRQTTWRSHEPSWLRELRRWLCSWILKNTRVHNLVFREQKCFRKLTWVVCLYVCVCVFAIAKITLRYIDRLFWGIRQFSMECNLLNSLVELRWPKIRIDYWVLN